MVASLCEANQSVEEDSLGVAPGSHGLCRAVLLVKFPMARVGHCLESCLGLGWEGLSSVRAPAPPESTCFEEPVLLQVLKRGLGTLRLRSGKNRQGLRSQR